MLHTTPCACRSIFKTGCQSDRGSPPQLSKVGSWPTLATGLWDGTCSPINTCSLSNSTVNKTSCTIHCSCHMTCIVQVPGTENAVCIQPLRMPHTEQNGQVISHYRPITIVEQHQCQHNSALPRTRHTAPSATTVSTCQALSGYQLAARQLSTTAMVRNSIATFTASFLVKPAVSRSTADTAEKCVTAQPSLHGIKIITGVRRCAIAKLHVQRHCLAFNLMAHIHQL